MNTREMADFKSALKTLAKGQDRMSDADKAELFNKTTEQIAESRANAEKQMIIEQALGGGEGKADAAQE